jgi:hypothetical protein
MPVILPKGIDALFTTLDNGKVEPLCEDCCPCGDFYVFSSVAKFITFATAMDWIPASKACPDGFSWQTNCCTENCLDELGAFAGDAVVKVVLDKGAVEYSTLGGKSMLCTIYDYFVQNNITGNDAVTIMEGILDRGIVFQCNRDKDVSDGDNSQSIIASVETYLQYAAGLDLDICLQQNPNDPCQCIPEACCFNITADVAAYLVYNQAIQ